MKMSQRDMEICKLIEQGTKGTELAVQYDISRTRVYQVYNKYLARKHEEETAPPLKKMLPPRLQKALVDYINDKDIFANPEKIKTVPLSEMTRKAPMMGKISIKELTKAMLALGYVKEGDEWLEEWYRKYKSRPWK